MSDAGAIAGDEEEQGERQVRCPVMSRGQLCARALAPYIAVAVFWWVWPHAWLAILAYHAQILIWNGPALRRVRLPGRRRDALLALPMVLAGPLLYVLLPVIVRTDFSAWLDAHHLSGVGLVLMIPYFGLVHPVLEQVHWHPLRERTAWSHVLFAGYHVLVLSSLLSTPWLVFAFCLLAAASLAWFRTYRLRRSLRIPVLSHALADLGIVVAAWASTR